MSGFVGRQRELQSLRRALDRVGASIGSARPGQCVLVRGRRRVGKSRLVEEFCAQAGVPQLYVTASQQGAGELRLLGRWWSSTGPTVPDGGRDLVPLASQHPSPD